MEDVVVVGSGPAGLAAATWLGRYRRKTVVLDGGPPRNARALLSHGYLGFDGRDPRELVEAARQDLQTYPTVEVRPVEATAVRRNGDGFVITTAKGDLDTHRVILATGVSDALPDIPGFDELYGRHAFHCSCCDGYESADQDVVAIGWGEHAAGFAIDLLEWDARVVLITDGQDFEGDRACEAVLHRNGIEVIEEKVVRFILDGELMTGVELATGKVVTATRAFFSIKHHPRNDLARSLGCETDEMGYVTVGEHGETSIQGVYAAGDVTPGEQLVQRSAAEGAIAGIACAISLRGMSTASEAPEPGPDPEGELRTG